MSAHARKQNLLSVNVCEHTKIALDNELIVDVFLCFFFFNKSYLIWHTLQIQLKPNRKKKKKNETLRMRETRTVQVLFVNGFYSVFQHLPWKMFKKLDNV